MIRNSIVAKLWLTIVAMVVVVLALLSILLQQFVDNYVYQQQTRELVRLASSVQTMVKQDQSVVADRVTEKLAFVQNAQILFSVPLTSSPTLASAYEHFSAQQRAVLSAGQPLIISGTGHKNAVSVYLLIPAGARPGLLVVTQPSSVVDALIAQMRNLIFFATMLGIVLATGLAFVVSKNLSRPLLQMNQVAEAMARGQFDGTIQVVTKDEVGRLGRTFNALAGQLARTIEALSMEKDQLSSILSSLEDGVVAADISGEITLANPPALRKLRSSLLAETGVPEPVKLPEHLTGLMMGVLATKRPVVRTVDWQGREVIITMTPLYESNGEKLRGMVAVLRDVTEEHRLDRLRKDFIANVSHELRTPLSMMQGYAEALLDEFGNDPVQRRELTEIIHDETLRMRRLVNDLLDLAQLESGQFQMAFAKTDISTVVRRVVRKFHALALERSISVSFHSASEGEVYVSADYDRLEQVFTNLVDNAIRHTGAQGFVQIFLNTSSKYAQVSVSDSGSGIPAEDLPFIWERFYKADKARTRGNAGTGLGLAITRHIVLEHGGDIIVESTLGQGTSFTVSVPLLRM